MNFEEWWCGYWKQKEYDIDDNCTKHQRAIWDHQQKRIDELTKELDQQRFNNKHNLSIDTKVSDRVKELEKENKELNAKINKVTEVFYRVYRCECKYTDNYGNCTDCLNERVLPDCVLSGEVYRQLCKTDG